MATSAQVADGIRDLNVEWSDSNELHEILTDLNEPARAMYDKFQVLADKVAEEPGVKDQYAQSIAEIANDFAAAADKLKEAVGEGLVRG